jgi:hypothetical protein
LWSWMWPSLWRRLVILIRNLPLLSESETGTSLAVTDAQTVTWRCSFYDCCSSIHNRSI